MQANSSASRLNTYHGPKRQMLGNQAGRTPPAWRANGGPAPQGRRAGPSNAPEKGSKILLSYLPPDVGESEVEILFTKTVGPVKDSFIVYNSQGRSKGMAVVTFHRAADAAIARSKYHGKVIDGKRAIQIEIVVNENMTRPAAPAPQAQPTLLSRIGPTTQPGTQASPTGNAQPTQQRKQKFVANGNPPQFQKRIQPQAQAQALPVAVPPARNVNARIRQKKGPRRLKKRVVTVADLDKEMDEYRASVET